MLCRLVSALLGLALPIAAQEGDRALPPLRAVQEAPLAPPVAAGVAIAVESEDGKPVANALVAVLPATWTPEQQAAVDWLGAAHANDANQCLAAIVLRFGERHRCDEKGRALVPATATHLAACSDSLAGEVVLAAPAADGVRVRLLRPRSLFVRIVALDGKPVAELPVSILENSFARSSARTDARGECLIGVPPRQRLVDTAIVAEIAGANVRAPLVAPLPRTPIELRLPEFGILRVLAYDDREQPRTDVENAFLWWGGGSSVSARPDKKGDILVRAALGLQFEVRVTLRGTTGTLNAKCAGPTRAGELVVADVRATQGPPVLVFTVRGRNGKPVPDGELVGGVDDGTPLEIESLRVGTDGCVHLTLPDAQPGQRLFVRRLERNRNGTMSSDGAALVPLPQQLQAGDNELADVHLVEEPVIAAGVVVDDEGKPMTDATIRANVQGGESRSFVPLGEALRPDAQGRFEVRELRAVESFELGTVMTPAGYEPTRIEVRNGTRDARLVLARQGRVHLVLEGVPTTDHNLLFAALVRAGETAVGAKVRLTNGSAWLPKGAGRYDLVLSLRRNEIEVVRIPDVVVQRNADTEDPRLVPFAWRDHLLPVTITTVDESGEPVAGVMLWCLFAKTGGGEGGGGGITDDEGRFFALVPKQGARFRFHEKEAPGGKRYRPVDRANVTTDQRFVLRPALRTRVLLQGDRTVAGAASLQWQARLLPGRAAAIVHGSVREQPAGDGIWDLHVDEPGTYEIRLLVGIRLDRAITFKDVSWGTIEVQETTEVQEFRLPPSDAAKEHLTRLRELLAK